MDAQEQMKKNKFGKKNDISIEWKKKNLIAVPPITFLSSVNSIEHFGALPLFIDINLNNYFMDPIKLEDALKKDKKKGPVNQLGL